MKKITAKEYQKKFGKKNKLKAQNRINTEEQDKTQFVTTSN